MKIKIREQAYDFIDGQLNDLNEYNMDAAQSYRKWVDTFSDIESIKSICAGISIFKYDMSMNFRLKRKEFKKDFKFRKDIAKVYYKYAFERFLILNNQ